MMNKLIQFQLDALLQEYAALRAEVIERHNAIHMQAYVVAAILAATLLIVFTGKLTLVAEYAMYGIMGISAISGIVTALLERSAVLRIAVRLQRIERKVNARVGSGIMEWERRWGGRARNSWRELFAIPESLYGDEAEPT